MQFYLFVVTLIQKNILDGHVTDVFLRRVQILRMQRFTQLLSAFILYVFSFPEKFAVFRDFWNEDPDRPEKITDWADRGRPDRKKPDGL